MGTSACIRYQDGSVYKGQIKDERPEGKGCLTFEGGSVL